MKRPLPAWLRDKLNNPPAAGAGVHAFLFSVARQLHTHMDPGQIAAELERATMGCERRVTQREIQDAVNNSNAVSWQPDKPRRGSPPVRRDPIALRPRERWPAVDGNLREALLLDAYRLGVTGVESLVTASPRRDPWLITCDEWLELLFPPDALLCLATDHPATARTRCASEWTWGPADACGLIVPSPMTAATGKGLDGRTSHRCLDNTGPRRWLVLEFDLWEGKPMPKDDQARLHMVLRDVAAVMGWPRLELVLDSGGKSLHAWFGPCAGEETARELMNYARMLGADTATWNRCQLVRLPRGLRRVESVGGHHLPDGWEETGEVRQTVLFWGPG